jgi:hypothetical protein
VDTHRLTSGNAEYGQFSAHPRAELIIQTDLEEAAFNTAGSGLFQLQDATRTQDSSYHGLWYSRNSTGTLFPLHKACMETSCRVIDHIRTRRQNVMRKPTLWILYHFLNERFLERHGNLDLDANLYAQIAENTENDILDLCERSAVYGPRSVLSLSRLEWWGGEYDVRNVDAH